ncbi:transporter [Pseudomonas sp. NPDC089534]|uniref:transporter n=1 Tax=Pseudomonas sp. NPDC089534 TaxID=3364468 RepID=UPI003808A61A
MRRFQPVWMFSVRLCKRHVPLLIPLLLVAFAPPPVYALGTNLGDAVAPPPGHDLLAIYLLDTKNSKLYSNGSVVSKQAKLDAVTTVVRYARPIQLGNLIANPQFAVFHNNLSPEHVDGLRHTSGVADPLIGFPVYLLSDHDAGEYLAVAPFLFLPIGEYDHKDMLNPGENRWKATLQVLYQRRLGNGFNLELVGEGTAYAHNDDYGPDRKTLRQRPWYETKAALTHQFNDAGHTLAGAGVYRDFGGQTKLDDRWQDDRIATTGFFIEASTFLSRSDQILLGLYRDTDVENGFKVSQQFRLRYLHIF